MSEQVSSIRDQIWAAVDPDGDRRQLLGFSEALAASDGAANLRKELGLDWADLAHRGSEFQRLIDELEAGFSLLVPRGWSIMSMRTDAIRAAVDFVRAGEPSRADDLLADEWFGDGAWKIKQVCTRLQTIANWDPDWGPLYSERARLLKKALGHHEAGAFEASIPLIHANIDGLVIDLTDGKKFFSKGPWQANLVDPSELITIECGLAALQALYSQGVTQTQITGSLSRHGIAHGRELGFDTRVNSAKAWSVLHALSQWALPKAREASRRRKSSREERNAGLQGVDETGKRLDVREFSATTEVLRWIETCAMGRHRRFGRFPEDLLEGVITRENLVKRGLPNPELTTLEVSRDGQTLVVSKRTVSGWYLGLGLVMATGLFQQYRYAGGQPPTLLVTPGESGWSENHGSVPDWC